MKRILKYIKEYRKECVLAPTFKLIEALLELLVPLVVASIIDRGIAESDYGYIVRCCLIMALLGTAGLACAISAQYFAAKAAVGFAGKLRSVLFRHVSSLSYAELDRLGTSALMTRMTADMTQLQAGVNLALRLLLRSPIVVFGAVIMAFTIDARAALVFVVTVPLLSVIVFGVMLITVPLYRKVQAALDRVTRATRENLTGVRVIRAFCKEDDERKKYNALSDTLNVLQRGAGRISALTGPLTLAVINFAVIAVVLIGGRQVERGVIVTGAVVALYNYMSQILVELIKMANVIVNMTKAAACGSRISAVLDVKGSVRGGGRIATDIGQIEFDSVTLRYHGGAGAALQDISFKINRGETVGIIGGTGSGKSSLAALIPRFYDASEGRVLLSGVPIGEYELESLRSRISVVPQKATLFAGTIRENLLWGANASDAELMAAVRAAQAEDVLAAKGGLDGRITQGGGNLSGGQRQRLTIARALVRRGDILILDDSASALDFATEAALRRSLRELAHDPTVVIISQRISSIAHADRILVLDGGRLVGTGTHDELLRTCNEYGEIWRSQTHESEE